MIVNMTAAEILWEGAGRPEVADVAAGPDVPCWWCGHKTGGRGRPIESLPATFPAPQRAACKESQWLCRACGWSLCEAVSLPATIAQARIAQKAALGKRASVAIGKGKPEKRMILVLDSGKIGVWTSPSGVSNLDGALSLDKTPLSVPALRKVPVSFLGISHGRLGDRPMTCEFLGEYPIEDLSDGATTGAGTEKFRSYHHFGTVSRWLPCTDSDKALMREWILNPPDEPWAGMIYDAKKHGVVFTSASMPGGVQTLFFQGENIDYDPRVLSRQIEAVNALSTAGAREEEMDRGVYTSGGIPLILAVREHDHVLRSIRGGPTMALCLYLRKSKKEMDDDGEE